jgi:hypothetical protein
MVLPFLYQLNESINACGFPDAHIIKRLLAAHTPFQYSEITYLRANRLQFSSAWPGNTLIQVPDIISVEAKAGKHYYTQMFEDFGQAT